MVLLPQRTRLAFFAVYVILLVGLSQLVFKSLVPPLDHNGLWFYAALLVFLAGILIEAPVYTTPGQAVIGSFLALAATLGYGLATRGSFDVVSWAGWVLALFLLSVCLVAGVLGIVYKDQIEGTKVAKLGRSGFILAGNLGRPAVLASITFLYALLAYHRAQPQQGLTLAIAWFLLVFARPLENSTALGGRLVRLWRDRSESGVLGSVVGHGVPGLVTVRHSGAATVQPGTPLLVAGDDGAPNVALALSYVGLSDGLWLRAVQLKLPERFRQDLPRLPLDVPSCSVITDAALLRGLDASDNAILSKRARLIGVVAPGSDTRILQFEVVRTDLALEEGRLLEAYIGSEPVMYQLLDGLTKEDVLHQKNTRGFVLGKARKVGTWNRTAQAFSAVRWVPQPNAPVFLVVMEDAAPDQRAIGRFPGTSYPVFCDVSLMVTHNTAVLGILGVGKTFLALELVERMILGGIRVICLDLTDQYERELAPYFHARAHQAAIGRLQQIGVAGARNVQRNVQEGGSINEFAAEVTGVVSRFLDPAGDARLLILNPNVFEVWRQDSKPFENQASMVMLTPAEVTRIVSEAALTACQAHGVTDRARCCLVYEEAHSLIPEWNAVANEGDKAAANGTARAILQGRKFGLGCLLVTQRTASVTKTVLNQCNTVFAMRVFDATGMEFLSNYIGDEYAGILSGLEDRHAVVFGKASSSADPVLVRVNDRNSILPLLRPGPAEEDAVQPGGAGQGADEDNLLG